MKKISVMVLALAVSAWGGCGAVVTTDSPSRLVGAEGQRFVLDDLIEIANDPNLDDDAKREAFRELGIEDEKLIDALLTL